MAEDALALARCRFDGGDAAGAPEVWALPQPDRAQAHPEDERAHQRQAARDALRCLRDLNRLVPGDRVIFTSGDHMEHHGATNTLRLLQIGADGKAEGLGEL